MNAYYATVGFALSPQVGYLVLSAFAFSLMSLFVKLAGRGLPISQIVTVRALVALALTLVFLWRAGIPLLGRHRGLLVLRGVFGFGALSCFYRAVVELPLAEATVIQFMSPIFTAVIAGLFLGERSGPRLPLALALGFSGVLLIARPAVLFGGASTPFASAVLLVAFSGAFLTGCAYTVVRRLSTREHELVIVLYFPLVALPGSIPWAVGTAVWPRGGEWLLLLAVGVSGQLAQVYLTRGMKHMPAGRAAVILYLQIVFAALWGVLFLDELPDRWTVAGSFLILFGTAVAARGAASSQPESPAP